MKSKEILTTDSIIANKIFQVRGKKVMIDSDIANLYGVETKRLNEQVKRNQNRFPDHFMFQLTKSEFINLKSQYATSSWGGRRTLPFVFTEHGILMLSNILQSDQAIQMSIRIIEVFVKLREVILSHEDIMIKLGKMETSIGEYKKHIETIFQYLNQIEKEKSTKLKQSQRKRIGFKQTKEKNKE